MSNKKFIYFPSFSAGVQGLYGKKENYTYNGISARFWSDNFPYKPYKNFLLTAGHDYKNIDIRNKFGLSKDCLVFGDSGGFQIASGAIKWDINIRQQIFEWLENNSDIAMNLDIPTRLKYQGKFNECLNISFENFKYFYENQTSKVDFLNVLQGEYNIQIKKWYQKIKEFQFQGWGFGTLNTDRFLFILSLLFKNKEHLKLNNKWLHILGTSKISDFILISQLQKSLNEINSHIQVTTDSSSPNRATAFGNMYYDYNLKDLSFKSYHLKSTIWDKEIPFPYITPFSDILNEKGLTLDKVAQFKTEGYLAMVHSNLYLFLECIDKINLYIDSPKYIQEQVFNKDILYLCDIIDKLVKDENPEKVFLQNEMKIKQICNKLDLIDLTNVNIVENNSLFKIV